MRNVRTAIVLGVILIVGAGLRAYNLDYGLPEVYEEATPMKQAWEMWGWDGDGVDLNPHFFKYPSLAIYTQFVGQLCYFGVNALTGRYASPQAMWEACTDDPSDVIVLARAITVLFGLGTVLALFGLGKRIGNASHGLVAAAVLAVMPDHVAYGRVILVDLPLTFFCLLALTSLADIAGCRSNRSSMLAGLWIGLAASTKYTGALLVVPYVAAHLQVDWRRQRSVLSGLRLPSLWWGLGAAVVAFVLTSPYCLIDFHAFWADLGFERRHMAAGHFGLDPGGGPATYLEAVWRNFGLWLCPFLLVGSVSILKDRSRRAAWAPIALFCLAYVGIILTWSMHAARYLMPALPCLALFASYGLSIAVGELTSRMRRPAAWVLPSLTVLFLLPAGARSVGRVAEQLRTDSRTAAKEWIEANIPPESLVGMEFYSPIVDERLYHVLRIPFVVNEPDLAGPFYDVRWYADCGHLVTSSGVSERYKSDPDRFGRQASFYAELEHTWLLVAEFGGDEYAGPLIRIYGNPGGGYRSPDIVLDEDLFQGLRAGSAGLSAQFLEQLGRRFAAKRWDSKAADVYVRLVRISPERSASALSSLGEVFVRNGRLDAAMVAWQQAMRADSTIVAVHNNLGVAHWTLGNQDSALVFWKSGWRIAPGDSSLYRNLKMAFTARGQLDRLEGLKQKTAR